MKNRKLPIIIAFFAIASVAPAFGQSNSDIVRTYLNNSSQISKDVHNKEFIIANEDHSQSLKGTVVQIQQTYNGIPVFGNYSTLLLKNNEVVNFVGDFTKNVALTLGRAGVSDASSVLAKVAQKLNLNSPASYAKTLAEGKMLEPKLVYFDNGTNLVLAYELEFAEEKSSNLWHIVADAKTAEVYVQQNLTLSCNFSHDAYGRSHNHDHNGTALMPANFPKKEENKAVAPFLASDASYRVFEFPVEAPSFGSRTLAVNPWDLTASPSGWQNDGTTEYSITRGNNVHTYLDESSTNAIGSSADGGSSHVFDFDLNLPADLVNLSNYKEAAMTNLFYANNKTHDILYKFGFTETSKNFQYYNFGKGGTGNDYVLAEARDGAGVSDLSLGIYSNANFSTPSEGSKPRMQMYVWLGAAPYFDYNAPSSVAGTSIPQIGLGFFGPPLWTKSITGDVAVSPTLDACTALPAGSLTGKIGIAKRGTCNFILKVKNMEDAGAIAAIIFNSADAATNPGEAISNMSGDGTTSITIPSVFLPQSQGENIVSLINASQNVNVTLKLPVYDGSLDNGIIAHEYGHGLSNRTTGTSVACLNYNLTKEQMGEGWSDFLALMFTLRPGDTASVPRGMATYSAGQETDGVGIRPAQYSPDFTINNYTYGDTNGMEYQNSSGVLVPDVHSIGFVWNTILWDLHWKYVEKYGYNYNITADATSGSARVFQTVLNGIKLQGCYPTFILGRDGIIAADLAATGGENKCLIWEVFAKRGVGVNASAGSKTNINDQVEDFTVPAECALAVSETAATKALSVYPNPAKDEFYLKVQGAVTGKINVEIFDASGKLVSSQRISSDNKEAINVQSLPNGVYIVKATGIGVDTSTKLIVRK
ncbi:MAG: T9SS-dependent M36 family metallopeptidase [Bergeyella sp.]